MSQYYFFPYVLGNTVPINIIIIFFLIVASNYINIFIIKHCSRYTLLWLDHRSYKNPLIFLYDIFFAFICEQFFRKINVWRAEALGVAAGVLISLSCQKCTLIHVQRIPCKHTSPAYPFAVCFLLFF